MGTVIDYYESWCHTFMPPFTSLLFHHCLWSFQCPGSIKIAELLVNWWSSSARLFFLRSLLWVDQFPCLWVPEFEGIKFVVFPAFWILWSSCFAVSVRNAHTSLPMPHRSSWLSSMRPLGCLTLVVSTRLVCHSPGLKSLLLSMVGYNPS